MKMYYVTIPFFVILFIFLCVFLQSKSSKSVDMSSEIKDPELIIIKNNQIFLYKDGTALNFYKIDKFRVTNPWPNEYEIRAWIGWDCFVIKSGFIKEKVAEEWLKSFLEKNLSNDLRKEE